MKSVHTIAIVLTCVGGLCSVTNAQAQSQLGADKSALDGWVVQPDPTQITTPIIEPAIREFIKNYDSGIIRIDPSIQSDQARPVQVPVWSQVVRIDDAGWVRLRFEDVVLAKSTEQVRESYIRISSLEDGYEQYLDTKTLAEWGNTSAYFNGNAVRVELMASPNANAQINRIKVSGVQASEPTQPSDRSICFTTDDRQLSNDPRDGRLMPQACSAWLIGEHGSCFLTAAHCGTSNGNVMQFNVPLSSSGGALRSPSPQDQYFVDADSIQSASNIFIGNDWTFFGVFDNANTGLTPLQAQGESHTLATSPPPADGRPIRITGYGSTSSPVSRTWNGVQKTHVGPLVTFSGNTVRYTTDTTGGNSGSVILDDTTNLAIGIHTNAGCGSTGGANNGMSLFNSGLQNALNNPLGICIPRIIQASLLFEPTHISPDGGDIATLTIDNLHGQTIDGVPTMYIDSGNGFVAQSMSEGEGGIDGAFTATFPAVECGSGVAYYFEVRDVEGNLTVVPDQGEDNPFTTVALDGLTVASEDNFETDTGWTRSTLGSNSEGRWIRLLPTGDGTIVPSSDADGSGRCYVTGSGDTNDVDGDGVELRSVFFNLSEIDEPVLELDVWMFGQEEADAMTISVSDNGGISWIELDRLTNTEGWRSKQYVLGDHVNDNGLIRVRVTVEDGGEDTLVEGAIDGFRIVRELCQAACPADITDDGILDFFDVSAFLDAFGAQDSIADLTDDGVYDFFDVSAFLDAFGAGCP